MTSAAAIAMVPLPDDDELRAHTEALIDDPARHRDRDHRHRIPRLGRRGRRLGADHRADRGARQGARSCPADPKATGALRAAGLPEEWSPESESSRELLHYLVEGGISGQRIAVQLHGATDDWDPFPEFLDELRAAGAEVVPIRVYRWHPAPSGGDFDQLVAGIADEKFDAVSFTSAPAVAAMLMRAAEMGIEDKVLSALRNGVHAMCVGPVTARPLVRLGVPTSAPERMRLGALARHITDELPLLQSRTVQVAGHLLEIRGTCVLVDGVVKALSPAGMATIRALAHRPGAVVSRSDLLARCPAAAPTRTRSRRPCCGYERRWATRTSCRPWSSAATGWPSTTRRRTACVNLVLVAHGTRKPGCGDDRRPGRSGSAHCSTAGARRVRRCAGPDTDRSARRDARRASTSGACIPVPRLSRHHRHPRPRRGQRTSRRDRDRSRSDRARRWCAWWLIGWSNPVGALAIR